MRLSREPERAGCPDVLIRGIGIFTPAGSSLAEVCEGAEAVRSEPTHVQWLRVARVDVERTVDLLPNRKIRRMLSRGVHLGLVAAVAALADAEHLKYPCDMSRLGVFASGFMCLEDVTHVHALLKQLREQGQDWHAGFGKLATERLPPFMLLRCLPNAAFCHSAQYAVAKGYNATLLTGSASGIDCLRQAARAIQSGRLDAALVVACDSPLRWEILNALSRLCEHNRTAEFVTLGEAGCALYIERAGLRPDRERRAYARYVSSSACQSRDGVTHLTAGEAFVPPTGLGEAVEAATARCLAALGPEVVRYLELGGSGVTWLEVAERAAARYVAGAAQVSTGPRTGYLANCSGAVGLAQLCHLLASASAPTAGLVVRAGPAGQCAAALLQATS